MRESRVLGSPATADSIPLVNKVSTGPIVSHSTGVSYKKNIERGTRRATFALPNRYYILHTCRIMSNLRYRRLGYIMPYDDALTRGLASVHCLTSSHYPRHTRGIKKRLLRPLRHPSQAHRYSCRPHVTHWHLFMVHGAVYIPVMLVARLRLSS